jgi:hypothetical protein
MKIILENTSKIVELNGVPARIWEGKTDSGIPVHAFITRIGVKFDLDTNQFERELKETKSPSADVAAYPMRMIL